MSIAKKGKKHSDIWKERISNSLKGHIVSIETRKKLSNAALKQFKNGMPESTKRKMLGRKPKNMFKKGHIPSQKNKEMTSRLRKGKTYEEVFGKIKADEIRKKKKIAALRSFNNNRKESIKIINKVENKLKNILEKNNLPFNYVGNGKIWFRGETQAFNPDFLSKNPKHIIELFGDYWHNREDMKLRDKERLETYSKYGYKTLIIWEHELNNLSTIKIVNKIKEFITI